LNSGSKKGRDNRIPAMIDREAARFSLSRNEVMATARKNISNIAPSPNTTVLIAIIYPVNINGKGVKIFKLIHRKGEVF
jgi:hypothetical protein